MVRPNLERATAKVESLMQDTCKITRDVEGVYDGELDEDTGLIVQPGSDNATVYEGPCFVAPTGIGSEAGAEGQEVRLPGYRTLTCWIPKDAPQVLSNDCVEFLTSLRDPLLPGRKMTVVGVRYMTFAIGRRLDLTDVR